MLYRRGKLREAVGDHEPGRLRAHVDVVERPGPRIIIQRAGVDNDEVGPAVVAPAEAGPARAGEHPRAGPPRHPVGAKGILAAQPAETARRHEPVRHERRPAMLPAPRAVAVVHGCEFTLGLVTNPPAETASGHRMRPPRVLRHGAPSRAKANQGPLQDKLTASAGFTLMMWSGCTRSANVALWCSMICAAGSLPFQVVCASPTRVTS